MGSPWRTAVGRHFQERNPWLWRIICGESRDLFVRQHPPATGSLVLDVGAGWGQYTLPLARDNRVVAMEPTRERLAFIEAAARQERLDERIYFLGTDAFSVDFAPVFDLICCIGVLEWVPKFSEGDPQELQLEFLRRLRSWLRPGGSLLLGIENRLGLKYLLGAPDDHTGLSLVSVYDHALASRKHREQTGQELRCFTYSQAELSAMLASAGFQSTEFHAAYPDYKLPERILPMDERLESTLLEGWELAEHEGCSGTLLAQQSELISHYRSLAQMKVARFFAPSFFVVARP
jgi:SAM-dependent methyltransferase